jgi:hypothetical protein
MSWIAPFPLKLDRLPESYREAIPELYPSLQDFLQHLFDKIVQDILDRFDPARFPNEHERVSVANEVAAVICMTILSLMIHLSLF